MSTAFDANMGVKQGCHTSHHMFCLFIDRAQDFISVHTPPNWYAHTLFLALLVTFILLYAHDLALIADSLESLH